VSGRTVEALLSAVGQLVDRARTRGEADYRQTARQIAGFSRRFWLAHLLHRRFHLDGPLVDRLADRFERLLVGHLVLEGLLPYLDDALAPLLQPAVVERLRAAVRERQQLTATALSALGAQYPEYAALLEERFLRRVALRREDVEYRTMYDANVIGPELFGTLQRDVQAARAAARARPRLDLGLETRALIARVPLFASLNRDELNAVARLLRPRLAVPGERLIAAGDAGDAMYFISTGSVDVRRGDTDPVITLTAGDFFGEMALVLHQPRQADVVAAAYCQLLVLERRDFDVLLRSSRAIRTQIARAVHARVEMNE
jgi:CPA1 family monovalent cation:H+ antiporter